MVVLQIIVSVHAVDGSFTDQCSWCYVFQLKYTEAYTRENEQYKAAYARFKYVYRYII